MHLVEEGCVLETGEKESTLNTKSNQCHVDFLSKYDQFEKIEFEGHLSAIMESVTDGRRTQQ